MQKLFNKVKSYNHIETDICLHFEIILDKRNMELNEVDFEYD